MRRYWDASALVNAFFDSRVEKLSREPDQWTRVHTLAEMFSTFTGGHLGHRYAPADASAIVQQLTAAMNFMELSLQEVKDALEEAQDHGVRGGNIHDWLHACAARKAGATILLTDNLTDYGNLADGFKVEPP